MSFGMIMLNQNVKKAKLCYMYIDIFIDYMKTFT